VVPWVCLGRRNDHVGVRAAYHIADRQAGGAELVTGLRAVDADILVAVYDAQDRRQYLPSQEQVRRAGFVTPGIGAAGAYQDVGEAVTVDISRGQSHAEPFPRPFRGRD
jgi:hypothetical protein